MSRLHDIEIYQLVRAHRAQVDRLQAQNDAYRDALIAIRDTALERKAGRTDLTAPPDARRAAYIYACELLKITDDLPGVD